MLLMELTKYVLIRKDGVLSLKIMGGAGLEIDHIIEKCQSTLRIAPLEVDMVIQKMSMRIRVSVLNVLITTGRRRHHDSLDRRPGCTRFFIDRCRR